MAADLSSTSKSDCVISFLIKYNININIANINIAQARIARAEQ